MRRGREVTSQNISIPDIKLENQNNLSKNEMERNYDAQTSLIWLSPEHVVKGGQYLNVSCLGKWVLIFEMDFRYCWSCKNNAILISHQIRCYI